MRTKTSAMNSIAPKATLPPDLSGQTAWIISDGKAGHEVQCLGVAEALGLRSEIKRVAPRGLFKLAAPFGPVNPGESFGKVGAMFSPPWPAIAFAAGRTTIPYIRKLKRVAGQVVFTVILLDPKTSANCADLIWVPEHDARRGDNVVTALTSPHRFSAGRLAELRKTVPQTIAALPEPRVAVLIGGPNGVFAFTESDAARMAAALNAFARNGAGLMIAPSRRTPPEFLAAIDAATQSAPRILFNGTGENPYADFIAHADTFVVTADSINMAGEAAATGKPIYIFEPSLERSSDGGKFARFQEQLRKHGATRPLPESGGNLEAWTYAPLDTASFIAGEIERRLSRRTE